MLFPSVSVPSGSPASSRRTSPGIRAVAGGTLVTCAMLGVLVAPGGAEQPRQAFLVAATDVAPGERLDPTMVEPLPMALPPAIARRALTSLDEGLTARTAVPEGAVLHTGQLVAEPTNAVPGPQVTVAVPVARALGGAIDVGDEVDVIATYGSGTEGFSQVVAAGVVVVGVAPAGESLGVAPGLTVTLRLERGDQVLPVVHASHADALSLIGTGAGEDDRTATAFRPTAPEPEPVR